jgi:MFS family permease
MDELMGELMDERPQSIQTDPRRWLALGVLCLALSVIVIDNTILNVALPTLRRDLRASETDLQWITTAYALVLSGLLLPLAVVGDRFGRRRLLLTGLVIFGSASTIAAFTTSPVQLAVTRGVMGIGGAATMPSTLSILGNIFSERERGRAIAIWTGTAGIAAALGPVVGGLLLSRFWWGSVFLVNVPVVALTVAGAMLLVPKSRAPGARAIDTPGAALWSGALAVLLFAIIEGPVRGWNSAPVLGCFAGAVALLALFARRETRAPTPMLSPAAARHPGMRAGAVTVMGVFFAIFGTQFVLTQWIQGPLKHGPLAAGIYFVPFALATVVTATRNPALTHRFGHAAVILVGMAIMAVALLVTASAVSAHQLGLTVIALALVGAGEGAALPSGVELIMTSVPPAQAGSAAGVHETIVEAGGAVGVAVLGSTLAAGAGFSAPLLVGAAAVVVAGLLVAISLRRAADGVPISQR